MDESLLTRLAEARKLTEPMMSSSILEGGRLGEAMKGAEDVEGTVEEACVAASWIAVPLLDFLEGGDG